MGVKSTYYLTRAEAEANFCHLYVERKMRKIRAKAVKLSDIELEEVLEEWNDEVHGGEGFENYIVVADEEEKERRQRW